jgi:hypothetical protein
MLEACPLLFVPAEIFGSLNFAANKPAACLPLAG